jgi:cell wall-associated NlpC family hydrolase
MLPRMTRPKRPAVALVALLLAAAPAWAADAGDDVVSRFLVERGLVARASEGAAASWRDRASDMVVGAMHFLDVPYKWGGNSQGEGFDCSGFTRHVFSMSLGRALPRRADEQAHQAGLLEVERADLKPGDLVFFNTLRRAFSHVGIYIGDGRFIHSPRKGAQVRVENMRADYWHRRFDGARRAPEAMTVTTAAAVAWPGGVQPRAAAPGVGR